MEGEKKGESVVVVIVKVFVHCVEEEDFYRFQEVGYQNIRTLHVQDKCYILRQVGLIAYSAINHFIITQCPIQSR